MVIIDEDPIFRTRVLWYVRIRGLKDARRLDSVRVRQRE
jgi:hypothetical protein